MQWEKKQAKRTFSILAGALIAYNFLFSFVVFGIDLMEISALLLIFEGMQWEQATEVVYHSGIGLSIGTILGVIVVGLIIREAPSFEKKHGMDMKTIFLFYMLIQALQLLGHYILIPLEFLAQWWGYSFKEATATASDASVLFSSFFYSVAVAPAAEEILCRGIIVKKLEQYGRTFAILISAMFFGLLHQNIVQFPVTMLIGVLFGYVAQKYSLKAAVGLHMLNNASVEMVSILSEHYTGVWVVDVLFLYFCMFASIFILWKKRETIKAFFKGEEEKRPALKWFFTTPVVLLVIAYFLFSTIKSVTPF